MGQTQSTITAEDDTIPTNSTSTSTESPPERSLDSLISEAAAFGDEDDNLSLDEKAQKALECPCIAHLRSGPCGVQFSDAFLCFLKSTTEEKGSDCVNPFVALQDCIKANPDAFSKDVLENDDVSEEEKPSPQESPASPLVGRI